jgi:PEP-CTERM motif-containing protein
MKRIVVVLCAMTLALGAAGTASALPFSSLVDFSGDGTDSGRTFKRISDGNSSGFVGAYSHTVNFVPPADSVLDASLTIDYQKVNSQGQGNAEIWLLDLDNLSSTLIGKLDPANDWISKTFVLSPTVFAGVSGSSWTIGFKFQETTNGNDSFELDKSVLSGNYTGHVQPPPQRPAAVPEPGSLVLLGTGALGFIGLGRRMKK